MNPSNLSKKCAIVVNSCDAYEDVWPFFFTALKKNWPECDLEIYLNTETKSYCFNGLHIKTISTKPSSYWGERLLNLLSAIDKEFVINLFDDFIVEKKVNFQKIEECLKNLENNSEIAAFYFIHSNSKKEFDISYPGFDRLGSMAEYKINSAPGIWRKKSLEHFTGVIDSPWAWESFGSARTYFTKHLFFSVKKEYENIFNYQYKLGGAIRRGKWVRSVVEPLIENYGLTCDFSTRGFADETMKKDKYSLTWKVNFFKLGFKMVGWRMIFFTWNAATSKIKRFF